MSETEWGGYTRYARLKSEWLVPLSEAFSLEDAMAIGTAGYTAALCVDALEDWNLIGSRKGEILVTGAAGGVGSVAISLLANKGHTVVASTGRTETHDYLTSLVHRPLSIVPSFPRRDPLCRKSVGSERSIRWGQSRLQTCLHRPSMAELLRLVVSLEAWICRPALLHISCAVSPCWNRFRDGFPG
jgi:hypothetical protein